MKFCHSQVNGWNWRTSSDGSEGQKPHVLFHMHGKMLTIPGYKDLQQMEQYYGTRVTLRGIVQGKETKNLNVVHVLTVQE
jgi:hypothetical protein